MLKYRQLSIQKPDLLVTYELLLTKDISGQHGSCVFCSNQKIYEYNVFMNI